MKDIIDKQTTEENTEKPTAGKSAKTGIQRATNIAKPKQTRKKKFPPKEATLQFPNEAASPSKIQESEFILAKCMVGRENGDFAAMFKAVVALTPLLIKIVPADILQKYNSPGYAVADERTRNEVIQGLKAVGKTWVEEHEELFKSAGISYEICDWDSCLQHPHFQSHLENIQRLFWDDEGFRNAVFSSIAPAMKRLSPKDKKLFITKTSAHQRAIAPDVWSAISYVLEESAVVLTWSGYLVYDAELNKAMYYLLKNYNDKIEEYNIFINENNEAIKNEPDAEMLYNEPYISLPIQPVAPVIAKIKQLHNVKAAEKKAELPVEANTDMVVINENSNKQPSENTSNNVLELFLKGSKEQENSETFVFQKADYLKIISLLEMSTKKNVISQVATSSSETTDDVKKNSFQRSVSPPSLKSAGFFNNRDSVVASLARKRGKSAPPPVIPLTENAKIINDAVDLVLKDLHGLKVLLLGKEDQDIPNEELIALIRSKSFNSSINIIRIVAMTAITVFEAIAQKHSGIHYDEIVNQLNDRLVEPTLLKSVTNLYV